MTGIASPSNPRIKRIRKLLADPSFRRSEKLWVVEGVRFVEEAVRSGLGIHQVVTDNREGSERRDRLLAGLAGRGTEIFHVTREVFKSLSDTVSPQGILAVVDEPRWTPEDLFSVTGPVVILDRLRDPGNLGTIMRSALAAGAAGILMTGETVDPGNPKALRASAGAALNLPSLRIGGAEDAAGLLDMPIYATSGGDGVPPWELPLDEPFALLLGQEAEGVEESWNRAVSGRISIPMAEGVESLNVAAAAAVILFEAVRMRMKGR